MILDIYIAMEESYKKGYAKGCEDTRKEIEAERKRGKRVMKNGTCFCPQCLVTGSPQWKVCPVCETKMEGYAEC